MPGPTPNTYAFENFTGGLIDLAGGGSFDFSSGAGFAPEGLSFSRIDVGNTMVIGADGSGMHSQHASRGGRIVLRLLKTSPLNSDLSDLYHFTKVPGGANNGQIVITASDPQRGDQLRGEQCSIEKLPDLNYAVEGGSNEWVFQVIKLDYFFGRGYPG